MKKLFTLFLAILLSGAAVQAQTQEITTKSKSKGDMAGKQNPAMKDGIMMQGGKLMMVSNGVASVISSDQTLSNGTVVMPDGSVKMPDGTSMMLHDGDHINMNGELMHNHGAIAIEGEAGTTKDKTATGKTKTYVDDDHDKIKAGKSEKTKLKATDEKMKMKNNKGEKKRKYDQ